MLNEQLKQILDQSKNDKTILEGLIYLITEKGLSYHDLFGEELEIEFDNKELQKKCGRIIIKRKGMPLSSIIQIINFIKKVQKEEEKRLKNVKRPKRR